MQAKRNKSRRKQKHVHTDIARRKKHKDEKLTVKSGGFWGYSHLIPTSIFTIPPWGNWTHRWCLYALLFLVAVVGFTSKMVAWTPNPTLTLIGIPNLMHLVSTYSE